MVIGIRDQLYTLTPVITISTVSVPHNTTTSLKAQNPDHILFMIKNNSEVRVFIGLTGTPDFPLEPSETMILDEEEAVVSCNCVQLSGSPQEIRTLLVSRT